MLSRLFSRRERLRHRAAQWMARLQNDPDPADRIAFEAWYRAHPDHAAAFERVRASYGAAGLLAATQSAYSSPAETRSASPRRLLAPIALVATAALAAIAAPFVILERSSTVRAGEERFFLSTETGEIRGAPLADGSQIVLDTATRITGAFSGSERAITLNEGRIRLRVAPAARPFTISAGPNRIEVAEGTIDVSLAAQGATVQIWADARAVSVQRVGEANVPTPSPGEMLFIPPAGGEMIRTPARRHDQEWPSGRLHFDNVPLAEVVQAVNRYSAVPIRVEEEGIGRRRVTGVFRASDGPGLARSLAAAFDLRLSEESDALILRGRAPVRDTARP